jgi:hypothetical protein
MATKNKVDIILEIDQIIKTGGDIKAVDTNTILKDILDCVELNEHGRSGASTFAFASKTALIDRRGAQLDYSIRGIVGSFANITFKILIKETNVNELNFPNDNSQILKALEPIIDSEQSNQIDFLVKIKNEQIASTTGKKFRVGSLNFVITKDLISIIIDSQELKDNLFNGDQIFTSFAIHCPKINT